MTTTDYDWRTVAGIVTLTEAELQRPTTAAEFEQMVVEAERARFTAMREYLEKLLS